jgi:NADH:ubiquinone oxidoreductase subunit 6 (subunit J)
MRSARPAGNRPPRTVTSSFARIERRVQNEQSARERRVIRDPAQAAGIYLTGALILVGGLAVVTLRNLYRAGVALALTLLMAALLFLLLGAPLVGLVELVGGVAGVGFMLLGSLIYLRRRGVAGIDPDRRLRPLSILAALAAFTLLAVGLSGARWAAGSWPEAGGSVAMLAGEIGQRYAVALDGLAILLVAALVGAFVLGGRESSDADTTPGGHRKSQRPRGRST